MINFSHGIKKFRALFNYQISVTQLYSLFVFPRLIIVYLVITVDWYRKHVYCLVEETSSSGETTTLTVERMVAGEIGDGRSLSCELDLPDECDENEECRPNQFNNRARHGSCHCVEGYTRNPATNICQPRVDGTLHTFILWLPSPGGWAQCSYRCNGRIMIFEMHNCTYLTQLHQLNTEISFNCPNLYSAPHLACCVSLLFPWWCDHFIFHFPLVFSQATLH